MNELTKLRAKKLRFLRKFYDRKQIDIAQQLNLSQQAYSKLENGEVTFTNETISKLTKIFNISLKEFERPIDSFLDNIIGFDNQLINEKIVVPLQKIVEENKSLYERLLTTQQRLINQLEEKIERLQKAGMG